MSLVILLSGLLTLVQLNCENLFDLHHDSLKQDTDFLPTSTYRWTPYRYWKKVNGIGKAIVACGQQGADWQLPDLVTLCEVENDTVLRDLTKRSLLRSARYEYIVTDSPDERGIDVALLYSPFSFLPLNKHSIRVTGIKGLEATRDILYVSGRTRNGDTLHIFVVHAPSRRGGEFATRHFREAVARKVLIGVDSVRQITPKAKIIVSGDFNDYVSDSSFRIYRQGGLMDVTAQCRGKNGAKGTYRYQGDWGSLDHVLTSASLAGSVVEASIGDFPFLLEEEEKYGGVRPKRTYQGPKYVGGVSDHLPLVVRFRQ